jgi:ADP-heptose:LPS heptosyltransferase
MIKIIGTNQGQRGDLIMGTVVARAIKDKFPNSHFTLGVNKRYADMVNLFKFHPYIDDTHVWEAYDNWPGTEDVAYMRNGNFDIVLNPMPQHPNDHCWYNLVEHQTEAACIMNGFSPPKDLSCVLTKYFELKSGFEDSVCISPFTAWEKKNISVSKWQEIVSYLKNKNIRVIQLGAASEPEIRGAEKQSGLNYFESTRLMLSSRLLICLDGGLSWAASAYKHPTVGLYGYHYNNLLSPKMYEPLNPNATYLEAYKAEDIDDNLILDTLNKLL